MKLSCSCPHCQAPQKKQVMWPINNPLCSSCSTGLFQHATEAFLREESLDQCPLCGAAHVYRRKDFSQKLGIALVVLGVALSFFTYGISLLVVTLIDFFLFRRVGEVGICYQCKAEFRNSNLVNALKPFDLELSDYYRNLNT